MSILPLPGVKRIRATAVLRRPVAMNSWVAAISSWLGELDRLRLLGGMGMALAAINFQLPINGAAKPIVRNHAAHGAFDQQLRVAHPPRANGFRFVAAYISGKTHVTLLLFLLFKQAHFICVNHDNESAGVDICS